MFKRLKDFFRALLHLDSAVDREERRSNRWRGKWRG